MSIRKFYSEIPLCSIKNRIAKSFWSITWSPFTDMQCSDSIEEFPFTARIIQAIRKI